MLQLFLPYLHTKKLLRLLRAEDSAWHFHFPPNVHVEYHNAESENVRLNQTKEKEQKTRPADLSKLA